MDIIVVSHQRGRTWRMRLDVRHVLGWLPFALIAILLLSSSYAVGYWTRGGSSVVPPRLVAKRSEEHTSELQSLMRTSSAVFCLTKQTITKIKATRRARK